MAAGIQRRADGRFAARRSGGGGGGGSRRGGAAVVVVPSGGSRAKRVAGRVGGAVARAALDEKHTIAALVTAAALGYAKKEDMDIPHIDALGVPGTVGAALWLAGRMMKSRTLSHAATGALAIAVHNFVADMDESDVSGGGRRRRPRPGRGGRGAEVLDRDGSVMGEIPAL